MTTPKPNRRTCVFCGGTPLTREHVLPQWLKPIVPFEGKTGVGIGESSRTIPIPPSDRVARAFCGDCNSGWMNDLEQEAKPLLTPLILGDQQVRQLDAAALTTIAFWSAKTVLTCQYVSPPESRCIPRAACYEMREKQAPPHGTRIWIAPQVGDLWSAFYHLEPLRIWTVHQIPEVDQHGRAKINSYTATLGLGYLLIHVLYFANVQISLKDDPAPSSLSVRLVWPITHDLTWPPGPPVSNREATEFSGLIPQDVPGMDEVLDRKPDPPK